MDSKFLVSVILFSSWIFVGFCQDVGGVAGISLPCAQKLLPCQPYIHSTSPPASCCAPLKQMIEEDKKCLCDLFTNKDFLKSLNINPEAAMELPKNCGAKVDVNECSKIEGSTAMSPSSSIPYAPAGSSTNSSSSNSGTDSEKSSAGVFSLGGSTVVAFSVMTSLFMFSY